MNFFQTSHDSVLAIVFWIVQLGVCSNLKVNVLTKNGFHMQMTHLSPINCLAVFSCCAEGFAPCRVGDQS